MKSLIVLFCDATGIGSDSFRAAYATPVAPIPMCPTQMPLAPHHSWHVSPDTLRFRMGAFTCNTQPTRGNTDNG